MAADESTFDKLDKMMNEDKPTLPTPASATATATTTLPKFVQILSATTRKGEGAKLGDLEHVIYALGDDGIVYRFVEVYDAFVMVGKNGLVTAGDKRLPCPECNAMIPKQDFAEHVAFVHDKSSKPGRRNDARVMPAKKKFPGQF